MPWLRQLTRTGGSVQVTVPSKIAHWWRKAGATAVTVEVTMHGVVLVPQRFENGRYVPVDVDVEEAPHGRSQPTP